MREEIHAVRHGVFLDPDLDYLTRHSGRLRFGGVFDDPIIILINTFYTFDSYFAHLFHKTIQWLFKELCL